MRVVSPPHCVVVLLLALAIVAMTHRNRRVVTLGHHLSSRCGGTVSGEPFWTPVSTWGAEMC